MSNRKEGKWRSPTKFNPLMFPDKKEKTISLNRRKYKFLEIFQLYWLLFPSTCKRFNERTIVVVRHRIFETSCKLCYKQEHLKDQVISKFLRGFQQEGD